MEKYLTAQLRVCLQKKVNNMGCLMVIVIAVVGVWIYLNGGI